MENEEKALERVSLSLPLFHELIGQVNKDFALAGLPQAIHEPFPGSLEQCLQKLETSVESCHRMNPGQLKALLYRVDVAEEQLMILLRNQSEDLFERRVAFAILKREALKVLLKRNFSS